MAKSPKNLKIIFTEFLNRHCLNDLNRLAVAVSGGSDSMALLSVMAEHAKQNKIQLYVLTVDHNLRAEAKEEAQMVADWVTAQKSDFLKHQILNWDSEKPDTAIMEAARHARYSLMAQFCADHNLPILFVAHHQDDQAETFLFRLAKGSGLDGLGSMLEIRDYNDDLKIARPFLSAPKEDLIKHCEEQNIPVVNDPSNENQNYLRPRLRQSLGALADEGLTPERLAVTASRLSRARRALEEISMNAYQASLIDSSPEHLLFDWSKLKACPEEIAYRVLQTGIESLRPNSDYNIRMKRFENLFESLWHDAEGFKPRTLGGFKISFKKQPQLSLMIEAEKS